MTIEPSIAHIAARALVDWAAYRKCPICTAPTGSPCWTMSGAIAGGRPNGRPKTLSIAHAARLRRRAR